MRLPPAATIKAMKRRAINKDCGAQEFESIKKGANRRKFITNLLVRMGVLRDDLDYHLISASMVIIFLFFGYQKWFEYEAQGLSTSLRLRHLQMPLKFFQERLIACVRSGSWQDTHRTEIPTATSGCRTGIFFAGRLSSFGVDLSKVADGRLYEWHRFGHFHYVVPVAADAKYTLKLEVIPE
jgi:hypothetical protein